MGLLRTLKATAEQWTDAERLRAILIRAFAKFMLSTAGPPTLLISTTAPTAHVDCRFSGSTLQRVSGLPSLLQTYR